MKVQNSSVKVNKVVKMIAAFLVTVFLFMNFTSCGIFTDPLVGEWKYTIDQAEATLVITKEDGVYSGKQTIYLLEDKRWVEQTFTVKSIDDYIMTVIYSDGTLDYIPFAQSKNVLYFDSFRYTNDEKDVSVTDKDAYLVDGVITPVIRNWFYKGMTIEDVKKIADVEEKESEISGTYYVITPEKLPNGEKEESHIYIYQENTDNYGRIKKLQYTINSFSYYQFDAEFLKWYLSEQFGSYESETETVDYNGSSSIYDYYTWKGDGISVELQQICRKDGKSYYSTHLTYYFSFYSAPENA